MRFFPVILLALVAFVVVTDGHKCGPWARFCVEHRRKSAAAGSTLGHKCKVDKDCIYSHMETIVPRCTNGICDNYLPQPGDVHHIP